MVKPNGYIDNYEVEKMLLMGVKQISFTPGVS